MKYLCLLACLALVGCEADPINREAIVTGNKDVKADLIATFDDVRLYRVRDGDSRPIYVAVSGRTLRAEWSESHGKAGTVQRETITVAAP